MKKTEALREARKCVSDIIRQSSTSYVFYGPYNEPHGPSTEYRTDSYWKARNYRTRAIVETALDLMNLELPKDIGQEEFRNSVGWEIERAQTYLSIGNARSILNHVLKQV
jgi:hypothetical protein